MVCSHTAVNGHCAKAHNTDKQNSQGEGGSSAGFQNQAGQRGTSDTEHSQGTFAQQWGTLRRGQSHPVPGSLKSKEGHLYSQVSRTGSF